MTSTLARPGLRTIRPGSRLVVFGKGLVGVIAACLLWEAVRFAGLIDGRDLPALSDVAATLFADLGNGKLAGATLSTLLAWLTGLLLATVLGAVLGLLLGLSSIADTLARPFIEFLRPIPSAALIPIALVILGLGFDLEVALIVFASVWPVLFLFKTGVESTDPRYFEVGRVLGYSEREQTLKIVVVNALPSLATGIRTASAIALILAITVELVTGQPGIGAYLAQQRLAGQSAAVWAGVFLAGFLGYAINALAMTVERRVFRWSEEHRGAN